jgi:hypothetical protein
VACEDALARHKQSKINGLSSRHRSDESVSGTAPRLRKLQFAVTALGKSHHDIRSDQMSKLERPREIIDYCLKPIAAQSHSEEYKEVYRRLEHAIKTLQAAALKAHAPVSVDFSEMRTITLNEEAHGHE